MNVYHFSLGDSTQGAIGYCAQIRADTPEEAVTRLKNLLDQELDDWLSLSVIPWHNQLPDEYIEAYFNPEAITVLDIDEVEVPDDGFVVHPNPD